MDRTPYKMRVSATTSIPDMKNMEIGMLLKIYLQN